MRELPEILTIIEDVLYMVTNDEYDLSGQSVGTSYTVSASDATTRNGVIVEEKTSTTTAQPMTTSTEAPTPGFGVVVGLVALLGAALLALRLEN